MSDLLLQTIIELLETQGLVLQTMSTDADKAQIELRKKLVDLSANNAPRQTAQVDTSEIKKMIADIRPTISYIQPQEPVKPKPLFLFKKEIWVMAISFLIFMAMAWGWGYTFRVSTEYEADASKYRYLKTIPNSWIGGLCREVDSFYLADPTSLSGTQTHPFAGEKERNHPRSSPKSR